MHFYNQNILERIKIKKKEAIIKTTSCKDPKTYVQAVLDPFESQIKNSKMEVTVKSHKFESRVKADWKLYQLIIFNIIQNAVKYNKPKGEINICLKIIKQGSFNNKYCL